MLFRGPVVWYIEDIPSELKYVHLVSLTKSETYLVSLCRLLSYFILGDIVAVHFLGDWKSKELCSRFRLHFKWHATEYSITLY
jgi:hypothetical protein